MTHHGQAAPPLREKLAHYLARKLRGAAFRLAGPPPGPSLAARECPICGYVGPFKAVGVYWRRPDALCPNCRGRERHRFFKLLLDRHSPIPKGAKLLHFAAEPSITQVVEPLAKEYYRADIESSRADLVLNIENIDLNNNEFDVVICFHVLEHVDDAKALVEIFRILKPGGLALISVPIIEGWDKTYENPEITSEWDRFLHFGQRDHVRYFGRDVRDRIRAAGFELSEIQTDGAECARYALTPGDVIFFARKPVERGGE